MKYLKISNKGEIDVEAFTLIGASSKRGDNSKIGMFGSGNKYAISYLVRNNYEINAFSGKTEITFSTVKRQFRDVDFDVLVVNDIETSITSQMGPKWKLWQAIRELYSNALDEGGLSFDQVNEFSEPIDDVTSIYISIDNHLEDMLMDIGEYFLIDRDPIFKNSLGAIYHKTGNKARVYRKGIKVIDSDHNSLFDYDLFDVDIDEDRMAKHYWQPIESMWNLIFSCESSYIIRKIIEGINEPNLIENSYGNHYAKEKFISDQWAESLKNKQIFTKNMAGWLKGEELLKTILFPNWLYQKLINTIGDVIKPESIKFSSNGLAYDDVQLNDVMANTLSEALDFLNNVGFEIKYTIKVVDFKKTEILGSIDKENQIILLDIKSLDKGVDETVNTIIEEFIHLKHGVADETRGFQTAVITEFINYMKKFTLKKELS